MSEQDLMLNDVIHIQQSKWSDKTINQFYTSPLYLYDVQHLENAKILLIHVELCYFIRIQQIPKTIHTGYISDYEHECVFCSNVINIGDIIGINSDLVSIQDTNGLICVEMDHPLLLDRTTYKINRRNHDDVCLTCCKLFNALWLSYVEPRSRQVIRKMGGHKRAVIHYNAANMLTELYTFCKVQERDGTYTKNKHLIQYMVIAHSTNSDVLQYIMRIYLYLHGV